MEFYQIIILVIIAAVAIRISFKFDLNRYLENRRKIKLDQLKNICTHCKIESLGGKEFKVESYFSKPIGTLNWICSRCHLVVDSEDDVNRFMQSYTKNIEGMKRYLEKEKRFFKQMKSLKLV